MKMMSTYSRLFVLYVVTLLAVELLTFASGTTFDIQDWGLGRFQNEIATRWTVVLVCDQYCSTDKREERELIEVSKKIEQSNSHVSFVALRRTQDILGWYNLPTTIPLGSILTFRPEYSPSIPQRPKQYHGEITSNKVLFYLSHITGIQSLNVHKSQVPSECLLEVSYENFESVVRNPAKTTVVWFCSPHFPQCQQHRNEIDKLALQLCARPKVQMVSVDVSRQPLLASKHKLRSIPGLVVYQQNAPTLPPLLYDGELAAPKLLALVDSLLEVPHNSRDETVSDSLANLATLAREFCELQTEFSKNQSRMHSILRKVRREATCHLIVSGVARINCDQLVQHHERLMLAIANVGVQAIVDERRDLARFNN